MHTRPADRALAAPAAAAGHPPGRRPAASTSPRAARGDRDRDSIGTRLPVQCLLAQQYSRAAKERGGSVHRLVASTLSTPPERSLAPAPLDVAYLLVASWKSESSWVFVVSDAVPNPACDFRNPQKPPSLFYFRVFPPVRRALTNFGMFPSPFTKPRYAIFPQWLGFTCIARDA